MTFWASEKSLAAAKPYELHEFRLGATSTYYRYTAAPANITYGGNLFYAVYCEGSRIEQGVNAIKARTVVKVDWDNPFAWQYTVGSPDDIVHYTRYKGHGSDVAVIFKGDVIDVAFRQRDRQGHRWAEITIDPSTAAEERMGLVARYSRICTVPLYSDACSLARADFKVSGTLDSVDGNQLTSTTFDVGDGWWDGGDIVIGDYRRKMFNHGGSVVTINPSIPDLAGGESFDAYAGCDHTIATCRSGKFNNRANFRGQPNIPDDNPFSQWGII